MDRRAWRVTVHGFARVRHDLATKQAPLFQWPQGPTQIEFSPLQLNVLCGCPMSSHSGGSLRTQEHESLILALL